MKPVFTLIIMTSCAFQALCEVYCVGIGSSALLGSDSDSLAALTARADTLTALYNLPTRTSTADDYTIMPDSNTFYIDPTGGNDLNPGTEAEPWQTLSEIGNRTLARGAQILLKGGETFSVPHTFHVPIPGGGGTHADPIVFGSYGTGKATISPSSPPPASGDLTRHFCFDLAAETGYSFIFDNLIFNGWDFVQQNPRGSSGGPWDLNGAIRAYRVQDMIIRDCEFIGGTTSKGIGNAYDVSCHISARYHEYNALPSSTPVNPIQIVRCSFTGGDKAIWLQGSINAFIENNTYTSTRRTANRTPAQRDLTFRYNRGTNIGGAFIEANTAERGVLILLNFVDGYLWNKDDMGAFYTWDNISAFGGNPIYADRSFIIGNVAINEMDNGLTTSPRPMQHGIYLDDQARGWLVAENVIRGNTGGKSTLLAPAYLHNARDNELRNNIFMGGRDAMFFREDNIVVKHEPTFKMEGNKLFGNIVLSGQSQTAGDRERNYAVTMQSVITGTRTATNFVSESAGNYYACDVSASCFTTNYDEGSTFTRYSLSRWAAVSDGDETGSMFLGTEGNIRVDINTSMTSDTVLNMTGRVDVNGKPFNNDEVILAPLQGVVSKPYVEPQPELDLTPSELTFGTVLLGEKSEKRSIHVSGTELMGNVFVSAPDGFKISMEMDPEAPSLSEYELTYNGESVQPGTIYIQCTPEDEKRYTDSISFYTEGMDTLWVKVSCEGIGLTPELSVSKSVMEFDTLQVGGPGSIIHPFILNGMNLESSVMVIPPGGVNVWEDDTIGNPLVSPDTLFIPRGPVSIPYNLYEKWIWVSLAPQQTGSYHDSIKIITAGTEAKYLVVKGYLKEDQTAVESKAGSAPGIYPNPFRDGFQIRAQEDVLRVVIIDPTGGIQAEFHHTDRVDLSTLVNGLYFARIETINGTSVTKVVKE